MKFTILALAAALSLTACGSDDKKDAASAAGPVTTAQQFPQEAGTPNGRWQTAESQGQDGMISQVLLFVNRKNEVALGMKCSANGVTAEKTQVIKSRIEGNQFEVLENVSITAKNTDGTDFCSFSLAPQTFLWQYENEVLTLANQNGQPVAQFSRIP